MRLRPWLLLSVLMVSAGLPGQPARHRAAASPSPAPPTASSDGVSVSLVSRPQPAPARGVQNLAWELAIRNDRTSDITIESLLVLSGAETLLSWSGPDLRPYIINVPDRGPVPAPSSDRIRAGEVAFVLLWMSARSVESVPESMTHTIRFTTAAAPLTIDGPEFAPAMDAPARLSAPLPGNHWVAANGPAMNSAHRRAVSFLGNRFQVAQRFAIDWLKVDDNGVTHSGTGTKNSDYFAYGTDVLAVADGTVSATRDGMPENIPHQLPPYSVETSTGNYVILDTGEGHYALYAHLQPGSLRAHVGEQVTRGQALGKVGNSGNSTEPHLHFHLCDANAPLACDGRPYALDHFLTQDGGRINEIPLDGDVVDFQ